MIEANLPFPPKDDPLVGDRYAPEVFAAAIRHTLQTRIGSGLGQYNGIRAECYNREEADAVKALLTNEERKLVQFSWWEWGK